MSFKNYIVIFFWACIPVVASANYFSTECSYCTDSGYKQAAVNAVPFPPGGDVLVIDYPQETLKSYTVWREEGPDGLYVFAYEISVPADKQADFDAVIDFIDWAENSDLEFDLPPNLGIYSVYDVIGNPGNRRAISDWLNQQAPIASQVQGVVVAIRGVLGNHNPNIQISADVTMPDGSLVIMEAVSRVTTTADGFKLVIEFESLYGVDTDGNTVHMDGESFIGEFGVVRGGNVSGLSGRLSQLGFTVHTQGDGGEDDLVCDWSCSGDTCTLNCTPATE